VILNSKIRYRLNYQIRCPEVRVYQDEKQLGIMTTERARNIAQEQGLDLIEVTPRANPPVCVIGDFGRLKYESKLKEKEMAKKQRSAIQEVKEIRLTPTIAEHDIEYKAKNIERFLESGKKVQIVMKFSPRELNHKDIGMATINAVIEKFTELAVVEQPPRFAGRHLSCTLSPKG
jgi:translation initiation factor IF-3